ncbi:hypothetical protein Ddc_02705 [Ditylenchus destructor]|nr:hypothetical protein Ddc_02705 [Ditylenchus destructor]
MAGSLNLECQKIPALKASEVKCSTLDSSPQCNGWPEGCRDSQWLAGFNAYAIENSTNAVLLDPICCESPRLKIDSLTCATERLNNARQAFDHSILSGDLIYRGIQCWHQYNSANTVVDLAWKVEICQYLPITDVRAKLYSGISHSKDEESLKAVSAPPENCPACNCHCGIDVCHDGTEPVRIVHKTFPHPGKCSCRCICRYECL